MNETATLDQVIGLALNLPPLEQLLLVERLMSVLKREWVAREIPVTSLQTWQNVYAGLSEQDIADVERIALDRSNFMSQES